MKNCGNQPLSMNDFSSSGRRRGWWRMWRRANELVVMRERQCLLTNLNLTRDLAGKKRKISINKSSLPLIMAAAADDCADDESFLHIILFEGGLPCRLSIITMSDDLNSYVCLEIKDRISECCKYIASL